MRTLCPFEVTATGGQGGTIEVPFDVFIGHHWVSGSDVRVPMADW